jgi:hypothetical protein
LFATTDPKLGILTNPVTLHRYLYAASDPISYVDPSGESFWGAIGGFLGSFSLRTATYGAVFGGIYGGVRGFIDSATDPKASWGDVALGTLSGALWGAGTGFIFGGFGPALAGLHAYVQLFLMSAAMGWTVSATYTGVSESLANGAPLQATSRAVFGLFDTLLSATGLFLSASALGGPRTGLHNGIPVNSVALWTIRFILARLGISTEVVPSGYGGRYRVKLSDPNVRANYSSEDKLIKMYDNVTWYELLHECMHAFHNKWVGDEVYQLMSTDGTKGKEQVVFNLLKKFCFTYFSQEERDHAAALVRSHKGNDD